MTDDESSVRDPKIEAQLAVSLCCFYLSSVSLNKFSDRPRKNQQGKPTCWMHCSCLCAYLMPIRSFLWTSTRTAPTGSLMSTIITWCGTLPTPCCLIGSSSSGGSGSGLGAVVSHSIIALWSLCMSNWRRSITVCRADDKLCPAVVAVFVRQALAAAHCGCHIQELRSARDWSIYYE